MNHDLIFILTYLKSHTLTKNNLCFFIHQRNKCIHVGCPQCLLSNYTSRINQYVSNLLFRIPI